MPYAIALLGMPMVAMIPVAATGALRAEGQVRASRGGRSIGWTVASVVWHAAGIALLCHWLFVCHQPAGGWVLAGLLSYHALGIAPAVAARRAIEAWIDWGRSTSAFPSTVAPRWE